MTLYEINEAIKGFDFEIDEETGEILNINELDSLQMKWDEKVENIACLIKNLRADGKGILEEATSQKKRSDAKFRKADALEKYLANMLDGQSFSTTKCDVSWRRSSRVDIINDALIPDEFCIIRTDRRPDKTMLRKAIKNGEVVNGAVLVETKNINIK